MKNHYLTNGILGIIAIALMVIAYTLTSQVHKSDGTGDIKSNDQSNEQSKSIDNNDKSVSDNSEVIDFEPGQVVGRYTEYSYDMNPMIPVSPGICQAFEIFAGDQALIDKYKDMIDNDNSVQRLSESGNLIINLPWNELSASEQSALKSQDMINLHLQEKQVSGQGALPCYSFFEVTLR